MAETAAIQCTGLRKCFGALTAVRDVSLTLARGQILGLVGPNGAGKTTLMRMLATLLRPTQGQILTFGHDALADPVSVRRSIGYLPDFFNLHRELTLAECLRFYAHAYGVPASEVAQRVRAALAATGLHDKADDLVRHLSRGMVQRLGMAMLIARDADVLILDEPASGLDPHARVQLRHLLRDLGQRGKAILISSHILNDLEETCTHVAIMDRGQVVLQGTVAELRGRALGGLHYRIRVLGDPAAARDAAARAGALHIEMEQAAIQVVVTDEQSIAHINSGLVTAGIAVAELRLLSDLENAFVRVTSAEEVQGVAS